MVIAPFIASQYTVHPTFHLLYLLNTTSTTVVQLFYVPLFTTFFMYILRVLKNTMNIPDLQYTQ